MGWITPTGHIDPDSKWGSEYKAYDGVLDNSTSCSTGPTSWSSFIELTHSVIGCTKIRFIAATQGTDIVTVDIDIYYGSAWHDLYSGAFTYTYPSFIEKSFSAQDVTKVRFRFYNDSAVNTYNATLAEVDFYGEYYPTVTVQAPTSVLPTTATGNGNITDKGEVNCSIRGFEYGLTQVATWEAHDSGSFSTGAYTKAITENLVANTTYWIRAYATNPQGTSYSAWYEFQTAAVGTIPTGTKIDICSDYSAFTYKLQKAETDDGETYIAYFVFSTDLSNKKALAYYKRILDLYLYFNSEDSGTAEVYVKRDSEASWYYVGSVSLTGTADIIVKHLATRLHAKHFLFKIQAANAFDFLGCLFEFLPGGMR